MSHTTTGQHLDTPIMARDREQLVKRLDHRDLKQTHVVVGDHPPEPRIIHDTPPSVPQFAQFKL